MSDEQIEQPPNHEAAYSGAVRKLYSLALSPTEFEEFSAAWAKNISQGVFDGQREDLENHLRLALTVKEKLNFAGQRPLSEEEYLSGLLGAAAISHRHGELEHFNAAWKEHLGRHDSLRKTFGVEFSVKLEEAIQKLYHGHQDHNTRLMLHPDAHHVQAGLVAVRRLPDDPDQDEPRFLVRHIQSGWSDRLSGFLAQNFSLSPAEMLLLREIIDGRRFEDIAERLNKSRDTLKTQSKSIYGKMGVSGREDVLLLCMHIQLLFDGTLEPGIAREKRGERKKVIHLPDGRRLFVVRQGAPNGQPFIYLHGARLGYGFTSKLEKILVARNLTAYCLERPGFGNSDPSPAWDSAPEDWAEIYPHVLKQLGLGSPPIVAHTSGLAFACMVARAHPDLVPAILSISGTPPLDEEDMLANFPKTMRAIYLTTRYTSYALRFILSAAVAYLKSPGGIARTIEKTYRTNSVDIQALEDPETYTIVEDGLRLSADGNFDGFGADIYLIWSKKTDWGQIASTMQCPVRMLLGAQDTINRASTAVKWVEQFAQVSARILDDGGQLIVHTHPEIMVEEIERLLEPSAI